MIDTIEVALTALGAVAGLGTLAFSLYNMVLAQNRPTGLQTGAAKQILRSSYLIIATLLFLFISYLIWKPLPVQLSQPVRLVLTLFGAAILLPSLGLYVWGLRTLGTNFSASSGFGVRLQQGHQLVTWGPYAYLRNPMYLGVILSFWGGLLVYRTWTMLFCGVIMFGLIYRAHKEDQALAQAFGEKWQVYRQNVPGWFPRIDRMLNKEHP